MFGRVTAGVLVGLTLLLLANGCGPGVATIDGEVTLDGKPLEKGLIVFSPADDNGVVVRAQIKAGHYHAQVVPGRKFVQITAPRIVEQRKESDNPNARTIEMTVELLAERFNTKSELQFEARPGANTQNWPVEAIPVSE